VPSGGVAMSGGLSAHGTVSKRTSPDADAANKTSGWIHPYGVRTLGGGGDGELAGGLRLAVRPGDSQGGGAGIAEDRLPQADEGGAGELAPGRDGSASV
jgi:hypothetical protein